MKYDFKTDVWSLGIVLYELSTGKYPFNAHSLEMLSYKIVKGKYKKIKGYSKAYIDIIN